MCLLMYVFYRTAYGYPEAIYKPLDNEDGWAGDTDYRSPTTLVLYPAPNYAITIPNNATVDEAKAIVEGMKVHKWYVKM